MQCSICGKERPGQRVSETATWVQREDGEWSLVEAAQFCNDDTDCRKAVGIQEEEEPDAPDS